MKTRFRAFKEWVNKKSRKDQFYLFLIGFGLIYLFCYIFLFRSLSGEKAKITADLASLDAQKSQTKLQIEMTTRIIKDPLFIQLLKEEEGLTKHLKNLENKLQEYKPKTIPAKEMPILIKSVIRAADNSIDLIKLEELPAKPWLKTEIDMATLSNIIATELYQHSFEVDFLSDYFSTLKYLKNLEKLGWPIYWDEMIYKVTIYPKANVSVRFHVLNLQKS